MSPSQEVLCSLYVWIAILNACKHQKETKKVVFLFIQCFFNTRLTPSMLSLVNGENLHLSIFPTNKIIKISLEMIKSYIKFMTDIGRTLFLDHCHLLRRDWSSRQYPEPKERNEVRSLFGYAKINYGTSNLTLRPPVELTTGTVPYLMEYIWFKPQGSNLEGIKNMSQLLNYS